MISIKRPGAPAEWKGTRSKPSLAERELAEVLRFYGLKSNLNKKFEFRAYKEKTVTENLTVFFFGKCAYCESKYWSTQPVDVEHFRPKGGVTVPVFESSGAGRGRNAKSSKPTEVRFKLRKPGYYWLAAMWDNLLPACTDCNRERYQKVIDDCEPDKFTKMKVGKGNHFPLVDETKRRLSHTSRFRERPLILDPTTDKPEEHLEFTDEGVVRPARRRGKESERGKASIQVYALQRMGLVSERRARAKLLSAQIKRVSELMFDFNKRPGDQRLEQSLKRELAELKRCTRDDEEYAGMAQQLVKKFLATWARKRR